MSILEKYPFYKGKLKVIFKKENTHQLTWNKPTKHNAGLWFDHSSSTVVHMHMASIASDLNPGLIPDYSELVL